MCERGAFHVFDGFQVPRQFLRSLGSDGLLLILGELLDRRGVVSEVNLGPDEQKRSLRTMVSDFGDPLERGKRYQVKKKNHRTERETLGCYP